jgi:hypothetical protein
MSGAIFPLRQYAFVAWCSIEKKHRDNFTFTFIISISSSKVSSSASRVVTVVSISVVVSPAAVLVV